MTKFALILILIFLNINSGWAKNKAEKVTFYFNGYNRSYKFYVPVNFSPSKKYPLVFVLHGGGGKAKGMMKLTRSRFNTLADEDNFIVIYPQGIGKSWNDGARDTFGVARKLNIDDVGFIENIIENLDVKVNVDRENIFACGISNGGFMAQRLAFELSDKISGIGVVAANLSVVQSTKELPEHPVPAIFINGTYDPLVPYNGGPVKVLKQKRGMILSVAETLEFWKKINYCNTTANEIEFPDINKKDGCIALKTTYQNSENPNQKVEAIKILGGGHTWPGTKQYLPKRLIGNTNRDFNGCDEIWSFLKSIMN